MPPAVTVNLSRREDVYDYRLLFGEVDAYGGGEKGQGDSGADALNGVPGAAHISPRQACFAPGKILGYSRWHGNRYGTTVWNIYIIKTCATGEGTAKIPGIFPAVDLLLHANGQHYSSALLALLKRLKGQGLYLPSIPESYYRYVHGRLNVGLPVRDPERGRYESVQA